MQHRQQAPLHGRNVLSRAARLEAHAREDGRRIAHSRTPTFARILEFTLGTGITSSLPISAGRQEHIKLSNRKACASALGRKGAAVQRACTAFMAAGQANSTGPVQQMHRKQHDCAQ